MSYPEQRHHGPGEVRAVLRPASAPPDLQLPATDVRYLATGATTAGAFGLYRWDMGPTPSGPSPHFHRTMTESFYVLDGAVRLFDGERWADAEPGDFLHVPVGGVHAFRNDSGRPASMLVLFTPGAPRERYFEALAERAAAGAVFADDAERRAFLAEHDQYEP